MTNVTQTYRHIEKVAFCSFKRVAIVSLQNGQCVRERLISLEILAGLRTVEKMSAE